MPVDLLGLQRLVKPFQESELGRRSISDSNMAEPFADMGAGRIQLSSIPNNSEQYNREVCSPLIFIGSETFRGLQATQACPTVEDGL